MPSERAGAERQWGHFDSLQWAEKRSAFSLRSSDTTNARKTTDSEREREKVCVDLWFLSVSLPGFIIYFSYGIWNSAEAALSRSSAEEADANSCKAECSINGLPVPEKEAFLNAGVETAGDEEDT